MNTIDKLNGYGEKIGARVLAYKQYTEHPDDTHLYIVIAERVTAKEYVTWLANTDELFGGFAYGNYFNYSLGSKTDQLLNAIADYNNRGVKTRETIYSILGDKSIPDEYTVRRLLKYSNDHELGYCWMLENINDCETLGSYSLFPGQDFIDVEYGIIKDAITDTQTLLNRFLDILEAEEEDERQEK